MKLDTSSSQRLDVLRFPLIVGVVFIHAHVRETIPDSSMGFKLVGWFSYFTRTLISDGLAKTAVPLFFLMSGYLFFWGFQWSLEGYKSKVLTRVRTLWIPFVFWNSLTLLLLAAAQSVPATQAFFSGTIAPTVGSFSLFDYLNVVLGITRYPIAVQFWFIRDLMIMVLLVPIVQLSLKTVPAIVLGTLGVLWFVDLWPVHAPSSPACLFFCIGAFLAISRRSLFAVDGFGSKALLTYAVVVLLDVVTKGNALNGYIHRLGVLFGIASALYVTGFALNNRRLKSFLLWTSGCSFFVFAVHEPLQSVMRKVAYRCLAPHTEAMILALYFFIPILVIAISIVANVTLRSLAPRLLSIMSGGR